MAAAAVEAVGAQVKKLVPLWDKVLVEKAAQAATTSGGVLLPESKAGKLNAGKVIAVGSGHRSKEGKVIPVSVKEGDKVLLPEYGGTSVKVEDKEYFLYRDDDLLAIVKE